jgi:hypothetical protein
MSNIRSMVRRKRDVHRATDHHQTTTTMEMETTVTQDAARLTPRRISNERPVNQAKVTQGVMAVVEEVDQVHH